MLFQNILSQKAITKAYYVIFLCILSFHSNAQSVNAWTPVDDIGKSALKYLESIKQKKTKRNLENELADIGHKISYANARLDEIIPMLNAFNLLKANAHERGLGKVSHNRFETIIKRFVTEIPEFRNPTKRVGKALEHLKDINKSSHLLMKYGSGYAMEAGAAMVIVHTLINYAGDHLEPQTKRKYLSGFVKYFQETDRHLHDVIVAHGKATPDYTGMSKEQIKKAEDLRGKHSRALVKFREKIQRFLSLVEIWKNKPGYLPRVTGKK